MSAWSELGDWHTIHISAGPYSWTITPGEGAALGDVLDGLRIDTNWQDGHPVAGIPDPWSCSFGIAVAHMRDLDGLNIGAPVHVRVDRDGPAGQPVPGYPAGWAPTYRPLALFCGRVSDLKARPHSSKAGVMVVEVVCTDYLVDLAGITVGTSAWPQELVADRITRIFDEAGLPCPEDYLYGTVAARDASPIDALSAMQDTLNQAAEVSASRWPAVNLCIYGRETPTPAPVPVTVDPATNTVTLPAGHGLALQPGAMLRLGSQLPEGWNKVNNGTFLSGWPAGTRNWTREGLVIAGQPASILAPKVGGQTMRVDPYPNQAALAGYLYQRVTGLVDGQTYTASAWLWVPSGSLSAGYALRVWRPAAEGGAVTGNAVTAAGDAGKWVRSSVTFVAGESGAATVRAITNTAAAVSGQWANVSGVQLVEGTVPIEDPLPAPLDANGWTYVPAVKSVAGNVVTLADAPDLYSDPAGWPVLDITSAGNQVTMTLAGDRVEDWPTAPDPRQPYTFGWHYKRPSNGNAAAVTNLPGQLVEGPAGWRVEVVDRPGLDAVIPASMVAREVEWSKSRTTRFDKVTVASSATERFSERVLPGSVPIEYRLETELVDDQALLNLSAYLLPEQTENGWEVDELQVVDLPGWSSPGGGALAFSRIFHGYVMPPLFQNYGPPTPYVFHDHRQLLVIKGVVEGQNPNGGDYHAAAPAGGSIEFNRGRWRMALKLRPDVPRPAVFPRDLIGYAPPYLSCANAPAGLTLADLDPNLTTYDLRIVRRPDA